MGHHEIHRRDNEDAIGPGQTDDGTSSVTQAIDDDNNCSLVCCKLCISYRT